MNWTLLYSGTEQSLNAWGLSGLQRTLVNQDQDKVSFLADGDAVDADPLFAYDSTVIIKRDGVQWFVGLISEIPRQGNGAGESMQYTIEGAPWHWLSHLTLQQDWMLADDPSDAESAISAQPRSRLILGQDINGGRLNTGEVITEVFNYAIAAGAPITIGTIEPSLEVPFEELKDITCAEAIRRMLRWHPDASLWFDYSTENPTIHIRTRANLTPVSYAFTGAPGSELSITPRYDLQVPGVWLKYEQQQAVDDVVWTKITDDKYPAEMTGLERKALVMAIQLAGMQSTSVRQDVTVAALPVGGFNYTGSEESTLDWWKSKVPALADASRILNIRIHDSFRDGVIADLDNELLSGSITTWMQDFCNVDAEEQTITALLDVQFYDTTAEAVLHEVKNARISVKFVATNALSQSYATTTSFTPAEAVPSGLAQNFYTALNNLHYEGRFTITEKECQAAVTPGNVLNLTGSATRTEWATMNAQIQQVTEIVDSGSTMLTFGPAEHLSPQDFVELLKVTRNRAGGGYVFGATERTTGKPDPTKEVGLSKITHAENSVLLPVAKPVYQCFLDTTDPANKQIKIDPSLISASATTPLQPREISVIDPSTGNKYKAVALISESHEDQGAIGGGGTNLVTAQASDTTVIVSNGVVYADGIDWTPTIGGTTISTSPAPQLTITAAGVVYLQVVTDADKIVTAVSINFAVSVPTNDATNGYKKLADVTWSGGVIQLVTPVVGASLFYNRGYSNLHQFWS